MAEDTNTTIALLQARIAELEAALADAQRAANRDPLTGLLNRAGFADYWASRHHPAGRMLALIDLDDFKQVNDVHGHAAGDAVLCAVAQWLRTLPAAARLGGDEFVAVIDHGEALPIRVGATLPDGSTVSAGLSIGLAPAVGDLSTVLARADAAMYRAKTSGTHAETYDQYRDDRPAVEPRPRVRLRDTSGIVAAAALRGAA